MSTSPNLINGGQIPETTTVPNLPLLLTFSILSSLSVSINCRVFHIVFVTSKQKYRPVNTLVAHLSAVVIGFTLLLLTTLLGKSYVNIFVLPGLCNVLSYLINTFFNLLSLNFAAIIWIRTRRSAISLRRSVAYRTIGIMWTITLIINLPLFFVVKNGKRQSENFYTCKPAMFLDSLEATIAYEGLRLFLFNFMVCLYMIRASIIMRSSMKHIQRLEGQTMTRRLQKVRLVYLHTIILTLIWLPCGICLFLYKISSPLAWTTDFIKYVAVIIGLGHTVLLLCPLSYVFLLEKVSLKQILAPCLVSNISSVTAGIDNHEHDAPEPLGCRVHPKRKRQLSKSKQETPVTWSKKKGVHIDASYNSQNMSLLTTVETTGTLPIRSAPPIPYQLPPETAVCSQDSSMPSALTPSTTVCLLNTTAEMHVEEVTAKMDVGPVTAEMDVGPVIAEMDVGPVTAEMDVGPVTAEMDVGPVIAEMDVGPVIAEMDVGPVIAEMDVGPVIAEMDVGPVIAEMDVGPVTAEIDVGPVTAEMDVGPVIAEMDVGPVTAEIDLGPVTAEMHVEPVTIEVHVEPVPVELHVEPAIGEKHVEPVDPESEDEMLTSKHNSELLV